MGQILFEVKKVAGKWTQGEFQWLDCAFLEDLLSIYQYLSVKPPELETCYRDYIKMSRLLMRRRCSPSSPKIECEEAIAQCLADQEREETMTKHIRQQGFKSVLERVLKGYMTTGRDIGVLA